MLIVNPFATATTAAGRDALVHTLESRFTVDVEHTTHRGHASELGAAAVAAGHDAVLVHGGDGTVNETVNGMLGAPADFTTRPQPQLGVIPGGSANVFARTFGVNADPLTATRQHIELLETGQHRSIGLGHTADRWFLFNTGMGMDAIVVREMERKRHNGKTATPSRYLWTTVTSFFANATNPGTGFNTGLGLFAATSTSVVRNLPLATRLLAQSSPKARHLYRNDDLNWVRFEAETPLDVQMDGDYIGTHTHLSFGRRADAITVVAPVSDS